MKNSRIICLFLLHFFALSFSQRTTSNIYFGIPKDSLELKTNIYTVYRKLEKGDKIICNLPMINYNRGNFFPENNYIIDELVRFLENNKKLIFKIKVYKCGKGNKDYNKRYIQNLSRNLKHILIEKMISNFIIDENDIGTCDDNLLKDKENPYYYSSGSFLEITVQ